MLWRRQLGAVFCFLSILSWPAHADIIELTSAQGPLCRRSALPSKQRLLGCRAYQLRGKGRASERGQERKEGERGSRAGRSKRGKGRRDRIAMMETQFFVLHCRLPSLCKTCLRLKDYSRFLTSCVSTCAVSSAIISKFAFTERRIETYF